MPLGAIGEEYAPQNDMPSLRDYLTREARLIREPGSGFLYSNTGFNLLELLIEEVTGRDFSEYMADEVLIPLGMHHSSFAWNETFGPAIATGHELQGTAVPPHVYPAKASGGLFTDVEDMALCQCRDDRVLPCGSRRAWTREYSRALYAGGGDSRSLRPRRRLLWLRAFHRDPL